MQPTASAALTDNGDFEAVSDAELVTEPAQLSAELDASPAAELASAKASNSNDRLRAVSVLSERVASALAESARARATLSDLARTAKFLSASVDAVLRANAGLTRELEALAEAVTEGEAERSALKGRIAELEQRLGRAERDAAEERKFLLDEQDVFLCQLLSEQDTELAALRQRLAELTGPDPISSPETETRGQP